MIARALGPGWRSLRVAVLGGSSLAIAVVAHAIGGGVLPSLGVLAVTALVLGLVAVPLTMRRCRLRLLLPVLAVEQVAVHFVLSTAAVPAGCLASGSHHPVVAGCEVGGATTADVTSAFAGQGWGMWLGHAAAVLGTGWLLARGERWLWRVADRLARVADPILTTFSIGIATVEAPASVPVVWRTSAPLPARGPPHRI